MAQKKLKVYSSKTGKRLGGGAAQLHYVKQKGGWDKYHYDLTEMITKKVYHEIMEAQSTYPRAYVG